MFLRNLGRISPEYGLSRVAAVLAGSQCVCFAWCPRRAIFFPVLRLSNPSHASLSPLLRLATRDGELERDHAGEQLEGELAFELEGELAYGDGTCIASAIASMFTLYLLNVITFIGLLVRPTGCSRSGGPAPRLTLVDGS